MSATLADIARATGSSISTVSRVLSNSPAANRISRETRIKIAQAAEQLGYRPNLLARSLRTRKTNTVAVMVSDIANPWFGRMASLIEQNLHRRGYSLIVCNSGEQAELEQEYLRLLPQKGIDGLIVVPITTDREKLCHHLPPGLALVVLDRPVEGVPASVSTDQQQAATLLCRELERIGARRVALVRGPEHVSTHRMRGEAVKRHFDVLVDHVGAAQLETGHAAWSEIARTSPDAIVCTNNFLGQGLMEAMAQSNSRLPIGCFDEITALDLLSVPLVSCVQNVPLMAERAVEMLLCQLQGRKLPAEQKISAQVVSNREFKALFPR